MPSKNKVVVTVNLNNAGKEVLGKIKTGLPGTISFIRKSDNKVMASHKVKAVKLITDFDIPLPKLEMGEYYIGASFGKAFNQVRFNVPDLRPFQFPKPGLIDVAMVNGCANEFRIAANNINVKIVAKKNA